MRPKEEIDNDEIGGQLAAAAAAGPSAILHDPLLVPKSCTSIKRNAKSKAPKLTKLQKSMAESNNGLYPPIACRYDSSLGKLRLK